MKTEDENQLLFPAAWLMIIITQVRPTLLLLLIIIIIIALDKIRICINNIKFESIKYLKVKLFDLRHKLKTH